MIFLALAIEKRNVGELHISPRRLFGDIAAVMIISSVGVCLAGVYQDI